MAPTIAMGAASRPPGSASRSSSPNAMKPPKASAARQLMWWVLMARAEPANAAVTSMAAADISSSRPESTACQ